MSVTETILPVSGNLVLTGYLDVPAERVEAVTAALPLHVKLTLEEPGCLKFDAGFCSREKNRLLVSEIFTSKEAFDFHQKRARGSSWAKTTRNLARHFEHSIVE